MCAVVEGNSARIVKLVKNDADVTKVMNEHNDFSLNALHLALGERWLRDTENHNFSIPKLTSEAYAALMHPAIVNLPDSTGSTPLHLAARRGNITAIQELVKAGADAAIKCQFGRIPLEASFTRDVIVSDAEAISQLIPENVDYIVLVSFLRTLQQRSYLLNLPHIPEVLFRLLFSISQGDFFSLHRVKALIFSQKFLQKSKLNFWFETQSRLGGGLTMYRLDIQLLHAMCVLVRKGLGAKTSPQCSAVLSSYKADGSLYAGTKTKEESNAKFEEAAKITNEIDSIFDGPLPLFDQCCLTIRRCVQKPKHENMYLLPLPTLIRNKLMLLDVGREVCGIIQGNK